MCGVWRGKNEEGTLNRVLSKYKRNFCTSTSSIVLVIVPVVSQSMQMPVSTLSAGITLQGVTLHVCECVCVCVCGNFFQRCAFHTFFCPRVDTTLSTPLEELGHSDHSDSGRKLSIGEFGVGPD